MEGLGGATRSGVVGGARTGRGAALWAGRGLGEDEASPRARCGDRGLRLWGPRRCHLGRAGPAGFARLQRKLSLALFLPKA